MDLSRCRTCRTCRGPVLPGYAFCYQCDQARGLAGGLLADAVAPIAYAVKGGELARDLRAYKSGQNAGARAAAARLGELLQSFVAGYGPEIWAAAGMSDGPTAVAVVPSGQGRAGPHPLGDIVRHLDLRVPVVPLAVRPEAAAHGRFISTGWLCVERKIAGEDMLLIDDTWVSGASAQSAAAALKLAGAARVAIIVLGRHVDPADPRSQALVRALAS